MTHASSLILLGGLGFFLLGIHHLTEGLKGLAGDSLRRTLQRLVSGRFSSVVSGVVFTALIQSSTAAILTVIGFVSAGLVTFSQAIGVIMGATLGTTSTPWIVAIFGFRVRIASAALPILGIGALLWLVAKGKTRSCGAILAGFGLIFIGIEYMQNGMDGVTWNFAGLQGPGALWLLAGVGILMTIVMQSSTAAAATTLVALNAGSITFLQGCAMIVGQSVGTAVTTAIVVIGGNLAVRRAALAHIIFSLVVGLLGMLLLRPTAAAADWIGAQLHDPDGVLALAAFSSIFKLVGIAAFYPWLNQYANFIVKISGKGSVSPVSRLDSALAGAGGAIALEAAWRAELDIARNVIAVVERRLSGQPVPYESQLESVNQIEHFLESLSLETTDLHSFGPRLVQLCHGLDHLIHLHEDMSWRPAPTDRWQAPASFSAGAQSLRSWLDATNDPNTTPNRAIIQAVVTASQQVDTEYQTERNKLLESVAMQRMPAAEARKGLDSLAWASDALHHSSQLIDSLLSASGSAPAPADNPIPSA